jgi:hypothetical protein
MNAFELAIAVFGLALLAWAITSTRENVGSRLLGAVVGIAAVIIAVFAAILLQDQDRGRS